ncbi:hypothetical protein [Halalkalibacter nanhaiisediminis]|uniref:hypothetical protein n=1 Tax=Halalkalibacter nanhaiisediminis TaxID=688079 RepID=UPI001F5519A4|nr:hypothetical protein [Halalkalibacter nanhaiisediminis]
MYYDYNYPYVDSIESLDYFERQQPTPPMGGGQGAQPMLAPPAFTPPIPAW